MTGRCGRRVTGVVDGARTDTVASQEKLPYWRSDVDKERNENPTALGTATAEGRCGREELERRGQGSVGS